MTTILVLQAAMIEVRQGQQHETAGTAVLTRWRLLDVLKAHTLIGVYDKPRDSAQAIESLEASGLAVRIWKAQGVAMAAEFREEWGRRSLPRRALGFSQEDRIVEDLARHLEAGRSLVAIRPRGERASRRLLSSASHLARIGTWSCRFVR